MSYSNYVLNQRLSNIEYQLTHGGASSTLEQILTNGNDANDLSILNLSNLQVSTINGSAPTFGADVYLAGGTDTLPQTFTGYNQFDEVVVFSGAGLNTAALQITETGITTTGSYINMLANNSTGAYNSIVQQGDASIYATTAGGVGTGALCLTNWFNGDSGIRIASSLIQMAGFISGVRENPLIIFPSKTSGNNPLMYFNSVGTTTSNLNIISDVSASSFSTLTQAGDIVLNANIYGYTTIYTEISPPDNMIYQYNSDENVNLLHYLSIQSGATFPVGDYIIFQIGFTTYSYLITQVLAYPEELYILGSFVGPIPSLNSYINNFIVSQTNTTSLTGGSVVLGSYNGSGMRISPTAIAFNTTPSAPTPLTSDSSTTIATTEYVKNNLLNYAPATGSTIYAPLASPAFTGVPTAPTPLTSDSSTTIATTAYVNSKISSIVPQTYVYSVSTTSASLFNFTWTGGSYTNGNMVITGEFSVFYIDGATGISYNTFATFSTGLHLTTTFPLGPEFSSVLQPTNMYNTTFIPSPINVYIGNTAGVPFINIQYPLSATALTGQLTCQAIISNTFPAGAVPPTPVLSFA